MRTKPFGHRFGNSKNPQSTASGESRVVRPEEGREGGGFQYLNLMRQQSGLYANSLPIPRNWHGRLANLGIIFPKELHHSKSENESERDSPANRSWVLLANVAGTAHIIVAS